MEGKIIIVPEYLKDIILLDFKKYDNSKIMSFSEFIKNYYYDYNEKAIYYLMNKYNYKYSVAKTYIDNTYFVDDKEYNFSKLNNLVKIKKELELNNLLIYNEFFKEKVYSRKIVFMGFLSLDKYKEKILNELKEKTSVEIINPEYNENYVHDIYEFNSVQKEIVFIAGKICELIKQGKNINNIVLLNLKDEYKNDFIRIFKLFNIPFDINEENLYSTKLGSFFFDNLDISANEILEKMKAQFNLENPEIMNQYNQIVNICNKYTWQLELKKIKEILINDFKRAKVNVQKKLNSIVIKDIEQYQFNDDDYVFLLGFSKGLFPKKKKDEEYISDDLKKEVGLDLTIDKNNRLKEISILKIKNIKNLIITYSTRIKNSEYEISELNEELGCSVLTDNNNYFEYSDTYNLLELGRKKDLYLKYGMKADDLSILLHSYPDNLYRSYNHNYKGIKNVYNNLVLSYSSLDNYFKCQFKYYVNSVLKLNIFEENFTNYIGSLFHFVLSKKGVLSLDEAWDSYLSDNYRNMNNKEKFFLGKLKKELIFILEVLEKQKNYTTFNLEEYEKEISIEINENTKFVGFVDKIMMSDNKQILSIVDYKTGNPEMDLSYIDYGIGMQLPIYAYLIRKSFPQYLISGFYLQKILPSLIIRDKNKLLDQQKKEYLKLQGYSTSNEKVLSLFDKTYENSEYIKSLKKGSNGFYAYSKTISETDLECLIEKIDEKINEAIINIKNNKFDINPKKIKNQNISCNFCKYKDICYMDYSNIVLLNKKEGDDNAEMDG